MATILLFLSGMAGLILQVCWFREFRLIFGMTTASASAVLAVFMGGLGFGNLILGRRADGVSNPLRLYAVLEAGVAVSAALTPFALDAARHLFIATGGQGALGAPLATLVRLGLAAMVLLIPTFLMGGTLPAAARAFTSEGDDARRTTAWLYGANTCGAVVGAVLATFFLLEHFGVRLSLWAACLIGVCASAGAFLGGIGLVPMKMFHRGYDDRANISPRSPQPGRARLVYAAAAMAGFVFFAMELVWYRMLAPILGGTTFTFGLILAVALAGIGCGALCYALFFARRTPSLFALAMTFLLGALCLAAPFAAGDRLAVLVAFLKDGNTYAFAGEVGIWTLVAGIVVFPFSLVSGAQFPLFIALCGAGREKVARQTGAVFFGNTVGSIAGALAGGFGLMPLLTATGAWQALVLLLIAGGAAVFAVARRASPDAVGGLRPVIFAGVPVVLALACLSAEGPTAAWRHGGVGAGRAEGLAQFDANSIREWRNRLRSSFFWEADGAESSIGISGNDSFAFYLNGKCDGSAVSDAGMQIMLGLIGAALHPDPKTALVVGLGTGETAGWLGKVDSIDRVDVVELEPAMLEMARLCAPVNHSVLENPKVHLEFNDARELLLTGKNRYDLIACEPSNPYRSGVANLFTQEFYRAARHRLAPDGMFLQWLQGYEVDEETVRTVLATLRSVFPHVEVWQTESNDLVLLCSDQAPRRTAPELRNRLASEPFASALPAAWFTSGAEGFLAHYMGGREAVDAFIRDGTPVRVNTDDRNHVEYGFARTLGRTGLFDVVKFLVMSEQVADARPRVTLGAGDAIDWPSVARVRMWDFVNTAAIEDPNVPENVRNLIYSHQARDSAGTIAAWESADPTKANLVELTVVAFAYAEKGDAKAEPLIARLQLFSAPTAALLTACLAWARNDAAVAAESLVRCFEARRTSPFLAGDASEISFRMAVEIARNFPDKAPMLLLALSQPFAVDSDNAGRLKAACFIAATGPPEVAIPLLEAHEPYVPWAREFLAWRRDVYSATGHALASRASGELDEFERNDEGAAAR